MFLLFTLLLLGSDLKNLVVQADLSTSRSEQKRFAQKAIQLAEACIQKTPDAANCYYYRGQARGILQGNSFWHYTTNVRAMLKDWEKAQELDPTLDYGGPDRMFAEVYTKLPAHFGPKDLHQNLPLALEHIQKAVAISDYPMNRLDLAAIYQKLGKREEMKEAVQHAKVLLPHWKEDPYYQSWLSEIAARERGLGQ